MHGDKKGLDPQMLPENEGYAKIPLPMTFADWGRRLMIE